MIRRFIAALLCRMMERSDEKTERAAVISVRAKGEDT